MYLGAAVADVRASSKSRARSAADAALDRRRKDRIARPLCMSQLRFLRVHKVILLHLFLLLQVEGKAYCFSFAQANRFLHPASSSSTASTAAANKMQVSMQRQSARMGARRCDEFVMLNATDSFG